MQGQFYFFNDHLYGPKGNTGVYIHCTGEYGYLYSSTGYTEHYLLKDNIYGPHGWTKLYLHETGDYKYLYGSEELPFLDQ